MKTSFSADPTIPAKDDPTIWRVDDELWLLLEPVRRGDPVREKPGRPRRDDRAIVDGLIWLARTSGQWSRLPRELGPKPTVHERFSEWIATGALARAWAMLPREYDAGLGLDWSWPAADGCIVKSPFGNKGGRARRSPPGRIPPTGPNPAPSGTR